jgi:hypothetical protein
LELKSSSEVLLPLRHRALAVELRAQLRLSLLRLVVELVPSLWEKKPRLVAGVVDPLLLITGSSGTIVPEL